MILVNSFDILPEDTSADVFEKMAAIGADALAEALIQIENGAARREKQDDARASYAKMIAKEDGQIDWKQPSERIVNLIRGLNPWPSAYTFYEGSALKIWRAETVDGYENGVPGEVLAAVKNKGFVVKTGDSAVLVTEVQAVGSKKMGAADYLRGHDIPLGTILQPPMPAEEF
jgi:methionyl-tRNA formyltransferase